jgi:hypothetical protein
MSTRAPTLPPPTSEGAPPVDLPPPPRRRRRWIVVLIAAFGALALVGSVAYFDATALRHDLLPLETFDSGTGSFDVTADDGSLAWAEFQDGAYVVHSDGDVAGGTASLTRTAYALRFAADVTVASGSGTILLMCAGDYEGQGFLVNTEGNVSVFRATPDGRSVTLDEARVPPWEPGDAHHVLVTCVAPGPMGDGEVVGMIDGEAVTSGIDTGPDLAFYAAGLKAYGTPIEVRFDNAEGGLDESVS